MEKPDVDSIEEPLARHFHRPEDDLEKPPLHRWHHHRDIRLPAPALRQYRAAPCPGLRQEIRQSVVDQIVDRILAAGDGVRAQILAPWSGPQGEYHKLLDDARKSGFVRVLVDGILYDLGEQIPMDKNKNTISTL